MTKDEIKALIAAKLAGQGTNIDAASVLPAILEWIIDLIPSEYVLPIASENTLGGVKVGSNLTISADGKLSGASKSFIELIFNPFEDLSKEEAAENLGISTDEFERLFGGEYSSARVKGAAISFLITVDNDGEKVYFFSGDQQGFGCSYSLSESGGLYTLNEV